MDNTVQLAALLEATTYSVKCYTEGELFSTGSAFCISPQGVLLTAAHVVTSRVPILEEDVNDPQLRIIARTSKGPTILYKPAAVGIKISFPAYLKRPIDIDVAILTPLRPLDNATHLVVPFETFDIGTQVLMAGFPDELEMPLKLDAAIDSSSELHHADLKRDPEEWDRADELLMIKFGIVGHKYELEISPENKESSLLLASYYIDNAMHSGASGGPVIDSNGRALGIITQRAVTEVAFDELKSPNKELPSGSALALSSFTVLSYFGLANATEEGSVRDTGLQIDALVRGD